MPSGVSLLCQLLNSEVCGTHLHRRSKNSCVDGQQAPYVGNICMDVCMIDVTDIPCCEGDAVEIFGDNLPVSQLAEWLNTIPYEVLTSVSERVKRVYVC